MSVLNSDQHSIAYTQRNSEFLRLIFSVYMELEIFERYANHRRQPPEDAVLCVRTLHTVSLLHHMQCSAIRGVSRATHRSEAAVRTFACTAAAACATLYTSVSSQSMEDCCNALAA